LAKGPKIQKIPKCRKPLVPGFLDNGFHTLYVRYADTVIPFCVFVPVFMNSFYQQHFCESWVIGEWREFHNEELEFLYLSPNVIWWGDMGRMGGEER
jgi:hypothetical protein